MGTELFIQQNQKLNVFDAFVSASSTTCAALFAALLLSKAIVIAAG